MNSIPKHKLGLSRLRNAPPPRPRTVGEATDVPEDSFSASQVEASQSKPQKTSLGRRLLRIGMNTLMVSSTLAGATAGVGIATNAEVLSEALQQENPVTVFGAGSQGGSEQASGKMVDVTPEGRFEPGKIQDSLDLSRSGSEVRATLGAESTQSLVNHYRQSDFARSALQDQLNQAEGQINSALQKLKVPAGETLLTARVPFPSGDGSILQVGGRSIPVGLRKLALEDLPLVIEYQVDPVETGLQVKLNPAEVEQARLPAGVDKGLHLGSVRAEVLHPENGKMELSGRVRLSLDDGSATRRALEKTTDPVARKALQQRLQQIERLKQLSGDQNLDPLLDYMTANREVSFKGTLQGKSQKMGDGTVHAWLTPDHDGDKRGDIRLSGELYTAAVDSMEFQAEKLKLSNGGGFLDRKVSGAAEQALVQTVPRLMDALRGTVKSKIQQKFQSELGKVEQKLDQQFDQGLDAADASASGVGVGLRKLDVDPQSGELIAELRSEGDLQDTLLPQVRVVGKRVITREQKKVRVASVSARSTVQLDENKPAVVIPGSSARQFLSDLVRNPDFQETFQKLTAGAREQVQEMAGRVKGPSGTVNLEVEAPFPSTASVDSPLGSLPKLKRKVIPFTADYQVNDFAVPLNLQIKPVEVDEAVRPAEAKRDGVFLGAVQVNTDPLTTDVSGRVQLKKQKTTGGAEWAEQALEKAFKGQDFGFQSEVSVGETESVFYLWVVPDYTGDGRADIAVAHRSVKSGAESLNIKVKDAQRQGEQSRDSSLGGRLNGLVGGVIEEQIESSGDQLSQAVSGVLKSKVSQFLVTGSSQAAEQINAQLGKVYSKLGELDIPVPDGMDIPGGKISMKLGQVKVEGDNIVSEYGNERTEKLLEGSPTGGTKAQTVKSGELQAKVPGVVFNSLLADSSVGGPFDWNSMLEKAADDSSAVKSMRLATDENGRTISPSLRMIDGKPTMTIQVDAETNGIATPVSAGARLLPGFLGDGLGWIADNTVGAVLGARLQTEIQVPLEFQAQGDSLKVKSGEVKFETPQETDFDLVDILPTRLLSSLITDGIASTLGPDSVDQLMKKADINADLSDFGLQWARVEANGEEGKAPDFTFGVRLGKKLPDIVSEQVADLGR